MAELPKDDAFGVLGLFYWYTIKRLIIGHSL